VFGWLCGVNNNEPVTMCLVGFVVEMGLNRINEFESDSSGFGFSDAG
jgi:hypothetical protein